MQSGTPDHLFSDAGLAALYDLLNSRRPDFAFYLPLILSARSVLDVGCGTGSLLRLARNSGHTGRLCGIDPAAGMLVPARRRDDIEWVQGDLSSVSWDQEFDLVVMTGHSFQVLLTDDDLRTALCAVHRALVKDGRFVFETRNPLLRQWENWHPSRVSKVTESDGTVVQVSREVHKVEGELVSFSHTFYSESWGEARHSHSTLRFLGSASLAKFLAEAGFSIDAQLGDWKGAPLTDSSPEIITFARRA